MPDLSPWLERACRDERLAWYARGLSLRVHLRAGGQTFALRIADKPEQFRLDVDDEPDIEIDGDAAFWERIAEAAPPPGFQSYGAWLRHDVGVRIRADPLAQAQGLAALERLVELARPAAIPRESAIERDDTIIRGRRRNLAREGQRCSLHWLESGEGAPILFLHTAGADARQYRHQLADRELAIGHRMFAFDLPWHGASGGLNEAQEVAFYNLAERDYLGWCTAFLEDVVRAPAIVVGCSMGAGMALTLAARRPDLVRGCIALEAPLRAPGRRSELLTDARIANGWHNPSYVRALLSPTAPQNFRDEACTIYAQARPGIYMGDLAYYSDEYDGAGLAHDLKACGRPLALLTGSYDYSASPANTLQLVDAIDRDDVLFAEMEGLGHFPMIEDPDRFRPHLLAALAHVSQEYS